VETVVLQSKLPCNQVVITKIVIFTLIALVMIYPWRRVVLPTSERSERHLEESIKHELLQMDRAEGFAPVRRRDASLPLYRKPGGCHGRSMPTQLHRCIGSFRC